MLALLGVRDHILSARCIKYVCLGLLTRVVDRKIGSQATIYPAVDAVHGVTHMSIFQTVAAITCFLSQRV